MIQTQTTTTEALFAPLDLAVFEQVAEGRYHAVGPLPAWLDLPAGAVELADHFPLLEVFFAEPDAVQSDVWTEPDPRGGELYLQAVAVASGPRHFVVLKSLPQALFTYQQLAHDFELEKEKVERLSRELEIKRREAERATQAKSDFLATMSHEIRTPLNAIIGMADVLSSTTLTAEQQKCVDIFQRNGVALLNLINDILDLSKVESGHVELERGDVDLRAVLAAAMEVVEVRVKAKGLALTQSIAPGVPLYLIGDPNRLRQIIINLLGNSIKFTEKGGLSITVEHDPDEAGADRLRFAVTDTGIGIPENKRGAIFESFAQADSSTTRKYGGTGLGLTISKQLVELMDGRIWVESEVGVGSTFYFTARLEAQADQTERQAALAPKTSTADLEARASGLRVLVVDDSDDNRTLILSYLKHTQSQIAIAENGQAAVEMFAPGRYDVILMDVEMPVMDGYEATREIRRIEQATEAAPTPVFALTAHAFADMAVKGYAAGFTALLTKPIRKATLLEAVAGCRTTGTPAPVNEPAPDQKSEPKSEPKLEPGVTSISVRVEEGMEDVVPGYLAKRKAEVALHRAAFAAGDFDAIKKMAHKMKGTGTGYGFARLTELGATLEKAALESNGPAVDRYLTELALYVESVKLEYAG